MITPSFGLTATERVLPKLALDFTTASLDSRIAFTRTTSASNPATYVNNSGYITAAIDNEPRFDYYPVTLACKGLLIEEARTNLFLQSSDYDQSIWIKTAVSVVTGSVISPDGTLNGAKLVEDTASGTAHQLNQSVSVSSGVAYTISIYAKSAERSALFIRGGATAFGTQITASYNLTATTATVVTAGTQTSATITSVGNGWYRCTLTSTTVTASSSSFLIGLENPAGTRVYTGNGTSGLYVWGAQLEAGAFATSYIPTTTTALTRNADVAVMTGTNFSDWYSAGIGGISVNSIPSTISGTRPTIQFDDATANEIIALRGNTSNPELYIVDNGVAQAQIDAGTISANNAYNLTGTWATNSCAAAINGNAAVTDSSATMPTVTQARLGCDGTNYFNGWLRTVRYWPQRITNAETQAFSK